MHTRIEAGLKLGAEPWIERARITVGCALSHGAPLESEPFAECTARAPARRFDPALATLWGVRRFTLVVAIAIVAFAAYWAITTMDSSMLLGDDSPTATPGVVQPSTTAVPSESPPEGEVAWPARAERGTINHVIDGDSLWVQAASGEIEVRLIGINAPETRPPAQCYGNAARDALREMLPEDSTVWYVYDEDPLDPYGRHLLYLWSADGTFINLELVESGYAEANYYRPNGHYQSELDAAERRAVAANRGQWGQC